MFSYPRFVLWAFAMRGFTNSNTKCYLWGVHRRSTRGAVIGKPGSRISSRASCQVPSCLGTVPKLAAARVHTLKRESRFGQKYPSGQVSPVIAPRLHEVAVAIGMAALVVAIIATRGGALMPSAALPLEGNHFGMLYLVLRVYGMSHTMLHVCRMVLCA